MKSVLVATAVTVAAVSAPSLAQKAASAPASTCYIEVPRLMASPGGIGELGAAIRYRSVLSSRAREIAILVVAGHCDSAFEQRVHEEIGRGLGLTDDELMALRTGAPLDLPDPEEAAVLGVTRALVARADLDDAEYARLGERVVFELTTLVGYYTTLALQLRVFRV